MRCLDYVVFFSIINYNLNMLDYEYIKLIM